MKNAILCGLFLASLSGCGTARFVTARTWVGGEKLYVAYTQRDFNPFSSTFEAKVLRCDRQPDNRLACGDEAQLNGLLNAGSATRK